MSISYTISCCIVALRLANSLLALSILRSRAFFCDQRESTILDWNDAVNMISLSFASSSRRNASLFESLFPLGVRAMLFSSVFMFLLIKS